MNMSLSARSAIARIIKKMARIVCIRISYASFLEEARAAEPSDHFLIGTP
jgi:hypothetical protein